MLCPTGKGRMTEVLHYVAPEAPNTRALVEGGFVKGVVTYLVMDNLKVMPMSTLSTITLLNNDNVKDIGALEEKIVHVGMNEVC